MGLIVGAIFSKLVGFFQTPFGRWVALGLACVAVLILANRCGHASGVREELAKEAKIQAAADAQVQRQAAAQAASANAMRAQLDAALADNSTRTQTLIRKVTVYVTAKADAACVVNTGFVQLWNGGASGKGSTPDAPRGPVEAASGVALSDVARADAANYGVAYDWRAEALTWRKWGADLLAHWNDKR